jgi:hypothetical protein
LVRQLADAFRQKAMLRVIRGKRVSERLTDDINRCELRKLRQKLKVGGKIAIVVPAAGKRDSFTIDDMNNHLYSW